VLILLLFRLSEAPKVPCIVLTLFIPKLLIFKAEVAVPTQPPPPPPDGTVTWLFILPPLDKVKVVPEILNAGMLSYPKVPVEEVLTILLPVPLRALLVIVPEALILLLTPKIPFILVVLKVVVSFNVLGPADVRLPVVVNGPQLKVPYTMPLFCIFRSASP